MKRVYSIVLLVLIFAGCKTTKKLKQTETQPMTQATTPGEQKPIQKINLPVFISTLELQKQLYDNFFAPTQGKYYPCAGKPDCDDLYKDLYVENPVIKIKGDQITIGLHLGGHVNALIFSPDVEADILLSSKPEVRNDTMYFRNVTMEKSSQSLLLRIASGLFEKQIISKIQDNAWYSFRPILDKYADDFRKQLPFKWESSVLLLSLNKIYLNGVTIQEQPNEGIIATFSVELATENSMYGQ
jgi:hypothetical protein